jgi:hypothetical protein
MCGSCSIQARDEECLDGNLERSRHLQIQVLGGGVCLEEVGAGSVDSIELVQNRCQCRDILDLVT